MTIQSMARTDAFHLTVEGGVARVGAFLAGTPL